MVQSSAYAKEFDGNELYRLLKSTDCEENGIAKGFVHGVSASFSGQYYVYSPGVTYQQLFDIVRNYLENHPEERHYNACELVVVALSRAFPIGKEKKSSGGEK
jgi:hypothetical protein